MSFTTDMAKFCKQTAPNHVTTVVRKSVMEIGNRVVMRSPVGDASYWQNPAPAGYAGGRFRANWQIANGSAPIGNLETVDASGGATVSRITATAASLATGGITFIVNNLPYAERIENGWSRQAPNGIVSLTELEFPEIFRRAQV